MVEPLFKIKEEKEEKDFAVLSVEPLDPGYGHTIGNALRRVLLASIPGAAVTSVKIASVKHRFSTLPGLSENIVDLLLNVKGLNFKLLDGQTSATVSLSVRGPKEVTGKDLELPSGVELLNPDHYIGSLSDKKAKLDMDLTVEKGYGYSLAEENKAETLGVIPTDAIFSPVRRVNYEVSATRVGRQTNLDKLTLSVWTNDAVTEAARLLSQYFVQISEPKAAAMTSEGAALPTGVPEDVLRLTIDEL